jgi:hypothetical protein
MRVPVPAHLRVERRHLARLEHQALLICHITAGLLGATGQRITPFSLTTRPGTPIIDGNE